MRNAKIIFISVNINQLHIVNTLIKETETFTIEYDVETNSILHTINRFLITDEWKDLLMTGHQYLAEHNLIKWISDNRNLPIVHNNLDDWLYSSWLPQMIDTGWKQWALVEPEITEGKLNQQAYQESFSKMGIEVKSFECLDEAKEWIR